MSDARPRSMRMPALLARRLERLADRERISFSAAMRIALHLGLGALERKTYDTAARAAAPSVKPSAAG